MKNCSVLGRLVMCWEILTSYKGTAGMLVDTSVLINKAIMRGEVECEATITMNDGSVKVVHYKLESVDDKSNY